MQRTLMAISSLLYLACAWTWLHYGFIILGQSFFVVTALSLAADSCLEPIAPGLVPLSRIADRTVGVLVLVTSTLLNCTSWCNAALSFSAVSSAVLCLSQAREAAKTSPHDRWPWVRWHITWHAWGAFAMCAVTWMAQTELS